VATSKRHFQLWNIETGKCLINVVDLPEALAQVTFKETTVVGTTRKDIWIWQKPSYQISFPHELVTAIHILNASRIVVGDIHSRITLYNPKTKEKKELNNIKSSDDVLSKMNRGVFSIVEFDNGFLLTGTEKSIDIWDLSLTKQAHPIGSIKSSGPIIQISEDAAQAEVYKFLQKGDVYEIITWTPTKYLPKTIIFDSSDDISEITMTTNSQNDDTNPKSKDPNESTDNTSHRTPLSPTPNESHESTENKSHKKSLSPTSNDSHESTDSKSHKNTLSPGSNDSHDPTDDKNHKTPLSSTPNEGEPKIGRSSTPQRKRSTKASDSLERKRTKKGSESRSSRKFDSQTSTDEESYIIGEKKSTKRTTKKSENSNSVTSSPVKDRKIVMSPTSEKSPSKRKSKKDPKHKLEL